MTFPIPCPVCGADDEHAAWREASNSGFGATFCPHPRERGHGTGCCCGGRSKPLFAFSDLSGPDNRPEGEIAPIPPAADMRYDDEDSDAVALVMVRVEYKDGRIREYGAREPQDFTMNDPETDVSLQPMRMAVQAPGSPFVPMMAAVPSLRLSFRANPRHSMHIRTERTAAPAQPGEETAPGVVQGEVEGGSGITGLPT